MPEENVTTKYKVDISDLKKNISEANRQIKLYQAEMKNASAGMAKGAETADTLTKKIEAQQKIVDAEKKKLQALKDELTRYNAKLSEGSATIADLTRKHEEAAKAYGADSEEAQKLAEQLDKAKEARERNAKAADNLRVKIINADTAVKNAEGQAASFAAALDDLQKAEDTADTQTGKLTKSVEEEGKATQKATDGGLKAFTVALGNLASNVITNVIKKIEDMGKAAVKSFEDFDTGRDALIKATGATGDVADELTAAYSKTAKAVGGDLTAIGQSVGEVNTRFGYTGDKLAEVSADFARFADITGMDATSAVQGISKALEGAGMDLDDYGVLMDKVTAASQASGIEASKLTESLSKYGSQMRAIGYDTEDTIAMLSQFEKSGVNTETAIKGLQTANQSWIKEGKDAKKELAALIKEIQKAPNDTEAAQKALEVFGKKAGVELADAIRSGRFEFYDFSDVVANSGGTVSRTFEETQSGIDRIKLAVQGLSVTFGEAAGKIVDEFAPKIESIIELFGKVISGDSSAEDSLADAVTELIFGALDKVVGSLPAVAGFFTRLVSKLAKSLVSAAPYVVKAIASVAKTVTLSLTRLIPELLQVVTDQLPVVIDTIIDSAPDIISAVTTLAERLAAQLPTVLQKIIEYLPSLIQSLADFITTQSPVLIDAMINIFNGMVDALPSLVQTLVDALPALIDTVTNFIADNAPALLDAVLRIVEAIVRAVPIIAEAIYPMIPHIMDTLVEGVADYIPVWISTMKTMFGKIAEAVPRLWEDIKTAFGKVFDTWKTNIFDRAKEAFAELWEIVKENADKAGSTLGETFGAAFKTVVNGVLQVLEDNLNFAPRAINKAIDAINKLPGVSIEQIPDIQLPRLANGAIVNKATQVVVGENGSEAIIPLERNKAGLREIASLLRQEMGISAGAGHPVGGTNVTLTQNISSPKALSAYEIWRQTKNMINIIKVQGV